MHFNVAKIAVSTAVYNIDKPYSYLIPANLLEDIKVGMRVLVPFGRGNKKIEGVVLKLTFEQFTKGFKHITYLLDTEPLIDEKMLNLALFMQKRYYATFYDIIKIMLPSGLWFDHEDRFELSGNPVSDELLEQHHDLFSSIAIYGFVKKNESNCDEIDKLLKLEVISKKTISKQKTKEKLEKVYFLNPKINDHLELADRGVSKEKRTKVVNYLLGEKRSSEAELIYITGVTKAMLVTMRNQGIVDFEQESVYRKNDIDYTMHGQKLELSDEQTKVFNDISAELNSSKYSNNLLFGVTGSGKTQVYIKLIEQCIKNGKSAIVLIPEIALTSQLLSRFTGYFGTQVAVLHSKLGVAARFDEWKKVKNGDCKVVIGTRSAVFAPVSDLGLIIIDEEHENTYKSENNPRYDAREVAKFRCFKADCTLLLSSATPSVLSYYDAQNGKANLHTLTERYGNSNLPSVAIYDMRELLKHGIFGIIGTLLYSEMKKNLENGEQTILFLNRRGNSKKLSCLSCGYVPECVNCSTNMTYHSHNERVMCHICGYSYEKPLICPKCISRHLKTEVPGTQKLEEEVAEIFPEATILRLDADTTKGKNAHNEILDDFKSQKADILIGTQMVSKGLDFENATLVGVIDADQSLFAEDYSAYENTFSQITQVVGRAGRRQKHGRAVIQTFNPDNEVLEFAKNQDYTGFYDFEINRRQVMRFPPTCDLFTFVATGENENSVVRSAMNLANRLKYLKQEYFNYLVVLGPTAAKMLKINGKYRYILTLRMSDEKNKRKLISGVLKEFLNDKQNKGVNLYVDLDGEC